MNGPGPWAPERYRPLLKVQAHQLPVGPRLRQRFDSSDLVQETLLKAHLELADFRGKTEGEFVRWLQQILARQAVDMRRRETAGKRDVKLEQSIHAALAESSARLEQLLFHRGPSPSELAERYELIARVAEAVEALPEDQRDAVILRHMQELPVRDIAERLGKTEASVSGLLRRGLRALNEMLDG